MSHRRAKRIRAGVGHMIAIPEYKKLAKTIYALDKTMKGAAKPQLPTLYDIHRGRDANVYAAKPPAGEAGVLRELPDGQPRGGEAILARRVVNARAANFQSDARAVPQVQGKRLSRIPVKRAARERARRLRAMLRTRGHTPIFVGLYEYALNESAKLLA